MYRAAVIGCGMIGSRFADDPRVGSIYSHAGAYVACGSTALTAVCDVDPSALAQCGERWGVKAQYRDAATLLAEQGPEIVSVCTPDATHAELIALAIAAPGVRAVLAEKPLARESAGARALVHAARDRGVVLAVNYIRRYAPSHTAVRDRILAGEFGRIQAVSGYYTKGILHNGTHWLDLARYLVGEIVEARGFAADRDGGEDPTVDAVLRFECGASGHLIGCDAGSFSLFEMDIIGSAGRVRLRDAGYQIDTQTVVDSAHFVGYHTLGPESPAAAGFGDMVLLVVEDIVQCLQQGMRPRCTGEDAEVALRLAIAIRDSARSTGLMTQTVDVSS